MSSISSSHGMFLATAMAVSGSVILLAFRLQKSTTEFLVNAFPQYHDEALPPRSCICLDGKKKDKKKKKVHFAKDVVDPSGNSEEYRKMYRKNCFYNTSSSSSDFSNESTLLEKGGKIEEMPANRMVLYNGILRDRGLHRGMAYSC